MPDSVDNPCLSYLAISEFPISYSGYFYMVYKYVAFISLDDIIFSTI